MYFLREYGQDAKQEGCAYRWFKFTGVDIKVAWENVAYEPYTWFD